LASRRLLFPFPPEVVPFEKGGFVRTHYFFSFLPDRQISLLLLMSFPTRLHDSSVNSPFEILMQTCFLKTFILPPFESPPVAFYSSFPLSCFPQPRYFLLNLTSLLSGKSFFSFSGPQMRPAPSLLLFPSVGCWSDNTCPVFASSPFLLFLSTIQFALCFVRPPVGVARPWPFCSVSLLPSPQRFL